MVAYPDKYPKVHGSWLRDARNIDTVAAGGRGGQTKTRSQKPKSGASGRASTEVTAEAAKMAAEAAAAKASAEVAAASISGLLSSPKHDCKPGQLAGAYSRSGTVYSGLAAGRPVAVKVADADADAEIIRELRSEVEVYQHLAELQGDDIPRLIDHGLLEVDGTLRPALVQKQIGNWAGADDQPEMLPLSVRQSAMNTPDRLHAPGVVHGDPRMDNLLFECADTPDCS
ncbi:hypothetical protein IWW41_004426 [Coemansia sp. RSA 2522]|nr:hypothetical protein IWW41_004426 [Coemansia sp. RSA 2522]